MVFPALPRLLGLELSRLVAVFPGGALPDPRRLAFLQHITSVTIRRGGRHLS